MSESFSYEDAVGAANETDSKGFSYEEATGKPAEKGFLGHARDLGLSAVKSAIAVPETVVGLADIATGGQAGKFLENNGGSLGFRPKEAKEFLSDLHTDQYKAQLGEFQQADGIMAKTGVALSNPSIIGNTVVESIAPMLAGGVAARGLMGATRLGQMGAKGAAAAGAIGEGATMAGMQAEGIRQQTDDGLLTPTQAGLSVATGVLGSVFGYGGGRLAQKLGIGDVDTMLARGLDPDQIASDLAAAPAKSIPRRVIEGAISEGFLEELPQSVSEQVLQNLALNRDWSEGVDDAIVMGTLAGMAMGGGASFYAGMAGRNRPADAPPGADPAAGQPPGDPSVDPRIGVATDEASLRAEMLAQQEAGEPAVPQTAPTDGNALLRAQEEYRQRAPAAEIAAGRAEMSPDDEILQATGRAPLPSQQMGLDPAAGPMSAAAALAVDTGASGALAQAAQIVDPETGEITEPGALAEVARPVEQQAEEAPTEDRLKERLAFVEQQAKRNGGWDRALVDERERIQGELAKIAPTAPAPEPEHQPAVESPQSEPAQTEFDVSARTPEQLQYLAANGQAGWKEAAQAELERLQSTTGAPFEPEAIEAQQGEQKEASQASASPVTPEQAEVAQSAPEADPQAAAPSHWDGMTAEQRTAILNQPGGWSTAKGGLNVIGKQIAGRSWGDMPEKTRKTISALMGRQASVTPAPADQTQQGEVFEPQGSVTDAQGQPPAEAAMPKAVKPSIKDVLAKQIPDMTDGEIRQAITHYGPEHKRTAKLQKEAQKRAQSAKAAQPTQTPPTAPEQSAPIAAKPESSSQLVQDYLDGKRDTTPTPTEVQAEQDRKSVEDSPELKQIDLTRFDRLIGETRERVETLKANRERAKAVGNEWSWDAKVAEAESTLRQYEEARARLVQVGQSAPAVPDQPNRSQATQQDTDADTRAVSAHGAPQAAERDLRAKSRETEQAGDVGVVMGNGDVRYVSLAEAAEAARNVIAQGTSPSPFQINNATGIRIGDAERVIHAAQSGNNGDAATSQPPAMPVPAASDALEAIKSAARRGEYSVNILDGKRARVTVLENAQRGVFSVRDGNDVLGTFKIDDAFLASGIRPRFAWAERPIREAAELFAADQERQKSGQQDIAAAKTDQQADAKTAEQPKPEAPDRFAGNKLFTADKVAAARARMKAKLGTLNSGIDPELLVDGMTIAGAYIESGVRNFTQYAKAMVEDMGEGVKPYLLSFWEGARNYPGLDTEGMTGAEESRRQFDALLKPEDLKTDAVGEIAEKPKKRSRKSGEKGDMVLTQDWGVETITGYPEPAERREEGSATKDAFLRETRGYLNAVADQLRAFGFEPHKDGKGKEGKPVSWNEGGAIGSGDVSLIMRNAEAGQNVYIHIGDTSLRGAVPVTPSGIAVMFRTGNTENQYVTSATNQWAPVDLSAKDLAQLVNESAAANKPARAAAQQEKRKDEPATNGAQDQGRAEAVRGRRESDPQQYSAQADSGDVAPRQSEDGRPAGEAGDSGRSGVRVPRTNVAGVQRESDGRDAGDGRTRAGGTGSPDAGAGGAGDAGAHGRVTSPAAAGAQAQDLSIANPLEIVGGSPVQRFNRNRAALELLQTLTEEGRQAAPDEQKVLAGYIGWGSFGQELFQGSWERPVYKDEGVWKERGQWLRDTLGESAWKSAQRSITNAHYTDPPTVMAMWEMVRRMGFEGGKVLEPSMGTGNFFSMMPADLKARSALTGIELDETTGAIAKQLFPQSNVRIMGYQDSKTPDGFYDLVIGNWPFENTPVADRRYNKMNPMLHDYFFLKTMDQVRPGGIVIGITSAGSMDKQNTTIRRELARQAELVASIRLPSGAFEEYAGTKVVTDIVILRKRPLRLVATPSDAAWVETGEYKTPAGETIKVNRYYLDNPQNIIGKLDFGHGTTTFRAGMIVHRPENMAERLRQAVELVPQGVMQPRVKVDHLTYYANETGERHGALAIVNDRLMIAVGDQLVEANEASKYVLKDAKKTAERERQLHAAIDLRKKHSALIDAERAGRPAEDARKDLRSAYEAFKAEHGALRASYALDYLEKINDPFFAELAALENDDGTPAAVMEHSTTRSRRSIESPGVRDAYVLARNQSVNPGIAEVARISGKPEQAVKAELLESGAVFEAPNGDIVPSDIYLSGNVRQKIREARVALEEGNKAMEANIRALQEVMPADVPYFNIETQFGATWVPNEAYAQYIAHMLARSKADGIEVTFNAGRWKVRMDGQLNRIPEASANYGTAGYRFSNLVQAAISNQVLRLTTKDSDGNEVYDAARTEEANARIAKIREDFGAWLWGDPERRQDLEREYNEARNAWATPKYDGSFLTFEGMALTLGKGKFDLRQHQANAIWRAIVNRRSINAHEVGTGKTFTMGGIAVESRRYGIAKKPMILAHNANSATVAAEIRMMYPSARVLYIDNLDKKNRDIRLRQIANDDWDAIVVPHSLIKSLALREETMTKMAADDIKALEAEFFDAAVEDGINPEGINLDDDDDIKKIRSVTAKELAKARKRIIENIKKQAQRSSKEDSVSFEDLGVDMILVDEVHEFKKPPIVTRMKMKGLNTQVSDRSIALQFLTRFVRQMNNGGNVHTFTGTPITNTITEIYHQMRYVMESEMEQVAVSDWDGWFGSFAAEVQDVELTASGDYEMVSRLAGFVNVPELRSMVGQYMDTVFAEDMPEMQPRKVNGKELSDLTLTEAERAELLNGRTEDAKDRPYKRVINESADMTAEQVRIFSQLQQYAREWRSASGKEKKEWMRSGDPRSPLITEGIANKASFDVRLLDDAGFAGQEGKVPDEPTSKASRVVKNVLEIYNSNPQANQVIFSENGFGKTATRSAGVVDGERQTVKVRIFSTMNDIVERLVQGGIPREQIAIVDGSTSKERRKEIAQAMNDSKIRVVIGSTDTLGVGVNMQRNLRAMHHVDAPYMPGELEQRNGRGLRQGNQWNTVLEYRYMTDRLDGKRWQILAVKQRFINAFMKANVGTRVIEGEAAADEQSDILESFSEAAGDPRILQRVKLQKKQDGLQRKERLYTQGIADMLRQERHSADLASKMTAELDRLAKDKTQEKLKSLLDRQRESFSAVIDGKAHNTRKDSSDALQAYIEANVRVGDELKRVGEYAGQPLYVEWGRFSQEPTTQISAFGQVFYGKGIAGVEAQIRNFPDVVESKVKRRDAAIATAENMQAASKQPFAQAADLERVTKQLQDLEKDLELNPVPPPAWLRQGAPIDSEVYRAKRPYIVAGHRYSKTGWFVVAEDDKGTTLIPYMEATDEVGMPIYEEREFVPPIVDQKSASQADASEPDVVADRAERAPSANPLRNADGTFARQDPADSSLVFSVQPHNATQTGISAADKTIYGMAAEGGSAAEILKFIASASRSPFNRQIARLLMKTGISPNVTVGDAKGWRFNNAAGKGNRYAAAYSPKTNTVALFRPADAERHMLHELIHAATTAALGKRGLASVQMRALFRHVEKSGKLKGMYGMSDVDEFVAEAFTNPDFQSKLRAVSAPAGSPLRSAWDWLVRIIKDILGLPANQQDALSRALEGGIALMRENMRMARAQSAQGAWVVTGYEKSPDGRAAGRATVTPTQSAASLTRDGSVAGLDSTVAQNPSDRMNGIGFANDPDIRYNVVDSARQAAKNIGEGLKSITVQDVKKAGKHKLTDWLKLGLQFMGRRQLVDVYGDVLPLAEYDRLAAQMEADKNDVGATADDLARRWGNLPDEGKLADLMHDATLAQIDADSDVEYAPGDDRAKRSMLKAQFKALTSEAQKVYRETRDHYRKHHAEVRQAITDRIMRSELREERRAELLKRMDDDFFKAIKGVYFPLARFGQYVVVTKDAAGKVVSVSRAETMAEAEAMRAETVKAFPAADGYQVGRVILSKEFIAGRDMVGRGFMSELFSALDAQQLDPRVMAELEDTLGQLYLSSLPDLSWAKHGIHRKGTPGFSSDARRAFAQNTFHGARYLAKLRYGDQMQAELDRMQKQVDEMSAVDDFDQPAAQRVVDEMTKRHEATMNPKGNPLSTALTSFGFVYYLGISPAAAIVNLSQTPLVAYPVLGAKWGFKKAGAALMTASKETMEGKNDLRSRLKSADEIAAYDEAVKAGVIDVTMAHDLAGIAQGEDAKVMWKIRPVMRLASFLFHHAERFNRQATFVAAYRLARGAGSNHNSAYEQAVKATYDGHFDYSAGNRPRVMQGNVARVVLLFKQYAQNMIFTIARNAYQSVKGESPEVRREARRMFGALMTLHAGAAGVLGLPMVGTLLAVASALGGSDDEPWDAEVALRNMLADAFGSKTSEVIAKGFSRLTPWDISGRVGLDKLLLPDVHESLEGQRWAESFATAMLGPVIGMGVNAAKGAQQMADGNYGRGLENMLPIFARNPIKAWRQYSEGEVDRTGVVIRDEVSLAGVLGQASGFSPSEIRLAFEGRSAVMSADRRINERRQDLLTQFARAAMMQDQEGMAEARQAIAGFNNVNPGRRITAPQMWQSVRNREKRIREAEDGVFLPRNRRDVLEEGRFATEA